jgi:hypothetical protein
MAGLLELVGKEGVLLNVSVRYWRAARKLQAADIGLAAENIDDALIRLGHKRLVPREALKNFAVLESRAHAVVDDSTFPFLGGIARFVPNARLQAVVKTLDGLKSEFAAEEHRFAADYERLRADARRQWRHTAAKLGGDAERLLATIEAAFPDVDALRRSFAFEYSLFDIKAPEILAAGSVAADVAVARARAAENARAKIEAGVDGFVRDCVATLRQQTAQLCAEMLDSMSAGGTDGVHQKTLNRLLKFIDKFKALNFANDADLAEQLEAARQQLLSRTAAEYRDNRHAQSQLRQGLERLRGEAQRLASQDTAELVERFGQLGRRKFNLAA